MTILATCASALPFDAQILIDRALNSPTLTVKYSGANAALVELRVNGESLGTRTVAASKSSGETNFTLNLSDLKDGDNEVEIRLFDRTGKLVGSDKTNISTEQSLKGPVFLSTPKVGATVMGAVDIKVGFGQELRNSYVSFFVDNNFKSMTNFPPYNFVWDTTREANGWHEIEAWAIDDSSTTHKTRKVRVFVNNPGGRTERKGIETDLVPTKNPTTAEIAGSESGFRSAPKKTNAKAAGTPTITALPPAVSGPTMGNSVRGGLIGSMSGTKPASFGNAIATGPKMLTPTGTRVAESPAPKKVSTPKPVVAKTAPVEKPNVGVIEITPVAPKPTAVAVAPKKTVTPTAKPTDMVAMRVEPKADVLNNVKAASNLIKITKGQRLPNLGSYAVLLNNQYVNFDVAPRVDNGVPMTPFRHLLEKAGGKVDWEGLTKSVKANADGRSIFLQIGDENAKVNELSIRLETAPYLERGRTIVPLSFLRDALAVEVEYDKASGHVLITSLKK
jgi:hypothetical protein